MGNLNYLDILAILIVLISAVTAIAKGLTLELLSLASVVLGLFLAVMFYPQLAGMLALVGVDEDLVAGFLAFVMIFVGTLIAGAIISGAVNRVLKHLHLKWMDRLLGGVFGLVRGYLINAIIFLALTSFQMRQDLLAESRLAEFFLAGARILVIFVPDELKEQFFEAYEWLLARW